MRQTRGISGKQRAENMKWGWKGHLIPGLIKKFRHIIEMGETKFIQAGGVLQSEILFEMPRGKKPIDTNWKKQTVQGPLQ